MRQGQDVGACEKMTTDPSVASFILRLQVPSGSSHAPFPYEGGACSLLAKFSSTGLVAISNGLTDFDTVQYRSRVFIYN